MADQVIIFKAVLLTPAEEAVIQSALGRWTNPPAQSVLQKLKSADPLTVGFQTETPAQRRKREIGDPHDYVGEP